MAKKIGKHAKAAKAASALAPFNFLLPSVAVAACATSIVLDYEPLVFDPSLFPKPAQAQAAPLATIDTSEVERQTAEPTTDIEYTAADYGIEATNLKDGVYAGSAQGFKSIITVQVSIKDGKIASIDILSQAEDYEYFSMAKKVISNVISSQSTAVDTISGATYSSKGILMAIRNALLSASGGTAEATPEPETKPQAPLNSGISMDEAYADGTFLGTGEGFNGDVVIAVSISEGKITSLAVVSTDDDEEYFEQAETLLELVLAGQSTAIDVVSGATYSSRGILIAIEDALAKSRDAASGNNPEGSENPDSSEEDPTAPKPNNPGEGESGDDPSIPSDKTEEANYYDGEYTACALCRNEKNPQAFEPYYLTLTIVVKNGVVVDIKDVRGSSTGTEEDTPLEAYDEQNDEYLDRVLYGYTRRGVTYVGFLEQLLENKVKPTEVVAISSATYSSDAFSAAYQKALEASALAYQQAHAGDSEGDSNLDAPNSGSSDPEVPDVKPGEDTNLPEENDSHEQPKPASGGAFSEAFARKGVARA